MSSASLFDRLVANKWLPPYPDPRADQYPLMGSWSPTVLITLAYVVGVCTWRAELVKRGFGQKVVKSTASARSASNRQAAETWDLVRVLMVMYNFAMVCYSTGCLVASYVAVRQVGYGLGCVEVPDPADRSTDKLVLLGYLFYFSKFIEMLDTVFFLMRGKVDQITFLHVFHHAAMPPSIWWGLKYAPGGIVYMFLMLNTAVHVVMYTYYGLAAAGLYRYLWWKNYLTLAQMLQFVLLILHQGQVFVTSTPCNYPKVFPAAIIMYAFIFLILFGNFYIKAYWRKQRLVKRTGPPLHVTSDDSRAVANGHLSNGHVPAKVAGEEKPGLRRRKDH